MTFVNPAIAQAAEIIAPEKTYIVTVDGDYNDLVGTQLRAAGISIEDEFEYAFDGFVVDLADYQIPFVQSLQYVTAIEQDGIVSLAATQSPTPSWGLDRVDQREKVVYGGTGSYEYQSAGTGSTIYIGDTGVLEHVDLAGRISSSGFAGFNDEWGTRDCNGHGTHVATTAAGTQYGIAKNATIVPIRLLNCAGSGSVSGVIAALDWILSPTNPNPKTQAVLNLSIGGGRSESLNDAIERLVNSGITVVVAAGRSGRSPIADRGGEHLAFSDRDARANLYLATATAAAGSPVARTAAADHKQIDRRHAGGDRPCTRTGEWNLGCAQPRGAAGSRGGACGQDHQPCDRQAGRQRDQA
jgi:subtilisin family serine protease